VVVTAAAVIVHIEATSNAANIHTFVFIKFLSRLERAIGIHGALRLHGKQPGLRAISKCAYPSSGRRRLAHKRDLFATRARLA
jgi:hypothetical protein